MLKVTPEELLVLARGQAAVDAAKKMVQNCPMNHAIVHDHDRQCVYYRNLDSGDDISTDYTESHIQIAHRDFPPEHPEHIRWDMGNTELAHHRRDYYIAKGR